MASSFTHHAFITFLLLVISLSSTTTTSVFAASYPKTLLLTVTKDSTSQYVTKELQRTPAVSVSLTLDLNNPFLWVVCRKRYVSSTYHPLSCGLPLCKQANANLCKTCPASPKPGCNKNTCRTLSITNPVTHKSPRSGSEIATDVVKFNSTNGSTTGKLVTVPDFLFACAPMSLLQGLAKGVTGVARLGRSKFSVASLVFALCLPPLFSGFGTPENGAVFLGDGPYNISPGGTGTVVDLRSLLTYTPIISNPIFPNEYFVGVQGIKIGGQNVPINKSLLSINKNGHGGTAISLVQPYTVLETSIFKAVIAMFDEQLQKSSSISNKVTPFPPFGVCYDILPSIRVGPAVPSIDLVLQSDKVVWSILGSNSIVRVNDANSSSCLAFVDGGKNPRTSIVIGGYQIEDNLLQFDVPKNRVGLTSTLIPNRIRCSFFNYTSNNV